MDTRVRNKPCSQQLNLGAILSHASLSRAGTPDHLIRANYHALLKVIRSESGSRRIASGIVSYGINWHKPVNDGSQVVHEIGVDFINSELTPEDRRYLSLDDMDDAGRACRALVENNVG